MNNIKKSECSSSKFSLLTDEELMNFIKPHPLQESENDNNLGYLKEVSADGIQSLRNKYIFIKDLEEDEERYISVYKVRKLNSNNFAIIGKSIIKTSQDYKAELTTVLLVDTSKLTGEIKEISKSLYLEKEGFFIDNLKTRF